MTVKNPVRFFKTNRNVFRSLSGLLRRLRAFLGFPGASNGLGPLKRFAFPWYGSCSFNRPRGKRCSGNSNLKSRSTATSRGSPAPPATSWSRWEYGWKNRSGANCRWRSGTSFATFRSEARASATLIGNSFSWPSAAAARSRNCPGTRDSNRKKRNGKTPGRIPISVVESSFGAGLPLRPEDWLRFDDLERYVLFRVTREKPEVLAEVLREFLRSGRYRNGPTAKAASGL